MYNHDESAKATFASPNTLCFVIVRVGPTLEMSAQNQRLLILYKMNENIIISS